MRTSVLFSSLLGAVLITGALLWSASPALADRYPGVNRDYRGERRPPGVDRHRLPPRSDHGRWRPHPVYPYRSWGGYPRHHHYRGDDFFGWLAFTAVTLAIIDSLDEQQQREHEMAMRNALRAPVGETIRWSDGAARGSVTTVREGSSSLGRYCREYTQDVQIGGRAQQIYGTACRNSDGSWEIMD